MQTSSNILEHVYREVDRLARQSRVFAPLTTESLARAGIQPGMRVLDVGCATGDVAFLAADLVGDSGSVFGVDAAHELVAVARRRAVQLDRRNVLFHVCEADEIPPPHNFDAVLGSYARMPNGDPVATLRQLMTYLRSGGIIVMHEGGGIV